MNIDVHIHVFPPHLVEEIDKYLEYDSFLKFICTSPGHKYASMEDVISEMEKNQIDVAAVGGFAGVDMGLCREMNDYVLETAQKFHPRILPMLSLNPHSKEMEKEMDRGLAKGAVGVGELFPWGQEFPLDGPEAHRLASLCRERDLPLLLHINEKVGHYYAGKGEVSVEEAAEFALNHPELKIIYAHWGGGLFFYELMPELRKGLQHVYYDISASPFLYETGVYRVAREAGVLDKVLLGTDYPLIPTQRYLKELQQAGLTDEEKEKVMGGNAVNIFNLGE